jgi:dsDNA-binding SOS-regulon protein
VAVIIKYIVERKGVEKMTFTSKKEADAYDKMLDSADQLAEFLSASSVTLDDQQLEELGLYLASNKEMVQSLFKGSLFSELSVPPAKSSKEK